MRRGLTEDPNVGLTGLISMALLGVLLIGGGTFADGLLERSWLRMAAGVVLLVGLSSMVWRAGRVVRRSLETTT